MTRFSAAMSTTFRSLRVRNFRVFFVGQLISLIGTWMQLVALGWLVYTITGSATQIGAITAAQFVPTLLGSIHGGLLADRFDKRRILIGTQIAFTIQATVLAVLAMSGLATLPALYVLALVQGIITTIDNPARQVFATEMVGHEELTNAVGLNSAMFNTARVLGPAIGGVLIEVVGTTTCFVLNAVSFLAVIAGLLAMRPEELFRTEPAKRAKGQLREGMRYAWDEPLLRRVLVMMAIIGTLAMNFQVVLPVVAKAVFHGNAGTYGFLSAIMGIGSLVGALLAASRKRVSVRLLAVAAVCFGISMALDAVAVTLGMEMVALALTGAAQITFMAIANVTIQLTSRADMRGRVMSIYMLLFLGSTPIGGPIMGWVCAHWGARWSLAIGAIACVVGAATILPLIVAGRRVRLQPGLLATGAAKGPTERIGEAAVV